MSDDERRQEAARFTARVGEGVTPKRLEVIRCVTERPILFSAPMVRALLAGRKHQTRRVAKGDVENVARPDWYAARRLVHKPACQRSFCENVDPGELACGGYDCKPDGRAERSPYGSPGDRLWVRETWAKAGEVGDAVEYRADNHDPRAAHWRPSIHMPRWASRLTLAVTGVRVERLQDISESDAIAEGIKACVYHDHPAALGGGTRWRVPGTQDCRSDALAAYTALWGAINGPGSWAANPWVWVVEFEVCK